VITVFDWLLAHWYLWWLFLFFFEGVRDFLVETWDSIARGRHKRRMKELKARERIARAEAGTGTAALPVPGPCVHRNVVPVISKAEEVVAWLCKTCDEKLPANWAVREEDL